MVIDLLPLLVEPVRLGEVPDVTARAHHRDPGSTSMAGASHDRGKVAAPGTG